MVPLSPLMYHQGHSSVSKVSLCVNDGYCAVRYYLNTKIKATTDSNQIWHRESEDEFHERVKDVDPEKCGAMARIHVKLVGKIAFPVFIVTTPGSGIRHQNKRTERPQTVRRKIPLCQTKSIRNQRLHATVPRSTGGNSKSAQG